MVIQAIYLASFSFPGVNNIVLWESNVESHLITAIEVFPTTNNLFKICSFITPKDGQVLISEKIVVTRVINCGHTANIFG